MVDVKRGVRFDDRISELNAMMWRLEFDPMLRSTMTALTRQKGTNHA
jgi:hypothetical protein